VIFTFFSKQYSIFNALGVVFGEIFFFPTNSTQFCLKFEINFIQTWALALWLKVGAVFNNATNLESSKIGEAHAYVRGGTPPTVATVLNYIYYMLTKNKGPFSKVKKFCIVYSIACLLLLCVGPLH